MHFFKHLFNPNPPIAFKYSFPIKNLLKRPSLNLTQGTTIFTASFFLIHKNLSKNQPINFTTHEKPDDCPDIKKLTLKTEEIYEEVKPQLFVFKDKNGQIIINGIHIQNGIVVAQVSEKYKEDFKKNNFTLHLVQDLHDITKIDDITTTEYYIHDLPDIPNLFFVKILSKVIFFDKKSRNPKPIQTLKFSTKKGILFQRLAWTQKATKSSVTV